MIFIWIYIALLIIINRYNINWLALYSCEFTIKAINPIM